MIQTPGRLLKAAALLLLVLAAAPGAGDAGIQRPVKRALLTPPVRSRALRVEGLVRRRRGGPVYAPDRVLVRFRPGIDETYADGLLRSYGFPAVRRIPGIGVYAVKTAPGVSVTETLAMLRRNGDIEAARPDRRVRLADVPDDPYFADFQYALRNTGAPLRISPSLQYQTTAGADIKAATAWDEAKCDPGTVIAVLDTGVDMTHPDLAGKFVSSGWDFANDDGDATDDHWHGTHVAGIAAAATDNAAGIAGVAWNARILPVKVVDETGNGWYSWIIDGIVWAADHGADVINLSLGDVYDDAFLEDACRYAHGKGVVVVASAGNDGIEGVYFPAAYDDYVLAVAASDFNDALAGFSSYGPEIDVAAPGVWILSLAPQDYVGAGALPYLFASGTSMAAPHVAGLAALIKSAKPDLAPDDIMKIIRYTADDINRTTAPGRDDRAGYGRINMARALAPYIID
jgi:subtilisin family serine protease